MRTIYENPYLTLELDSEKSILVYTWKPESEKLALDEFLTEATRITTSIVTNRVSYVIGNDTDFKFSIAPDLQHEMNKTILARFNNTELKKFAHVMSTEIITQLSVEQFFEENKQKTYADKFFDDLKSAFDWCLK